MVAHRGLSTRIVVQIDTQQLPSIGIGALPCGQPKHALAPCPRRCQHFRWGTGLYSVGTTEGHQIFVETLTRFAERSHSPQLMPIIGRIAEPVRVAVVGRAGVGRGTVARALCAAGVAVTGDASTADVHVLVIAEALKP